MIPLSSLETLGAFLLGFFPGLALYFKLLKTQAHRNSKKNEMFYHDLNNMVHDLSLWLDGQQLSKGEKEKISFSLTSLRNLIGENFDISTNSLLNGERSLLLEEGLKGLMFLIQRNLPLLDVEVDRHFYSEGVELEIEKGQFYQVLMNIIQNIKHAQAKCLNVSFKYHEEFFQLNLENDIGLRPSEKTRPGLGLRSIQEVVERNHGKSEFHCNDGKWLSQLSFKTKKTEEKKAA